MMKIYINNTQITSYHLEVPFIDTIDKTLDSFTFVIRDTSERSFKKYSRVRIVDDSINFEKIMALQSYTSKLEGETWIYSIECISPTKILENVIINGMADTADYNNHLWNQFSRVLGKINRQIEYENNDYYMTIHANSSIQSALQNVEARNFIWDGQVTAREIFDDFFKSISSYVIVTDFTAASNYIITTSGNYTIDYISDVYIDFIRENGADISLSNSSHEIGRGTSMTNALQNIDNTLPDNYKIANFETFNNSEYEVSKCQSIVSNAVLDGVIDNGWRNLRSDALGIYSTDNVCLVTDEPIYDVDEDNFTLLIPCEVGFYYVQSVDGNYVQHNGTEAAGMIGFPLPIGDYLYEKAEYDILPESIQKKSLWYERGKKNIYGFTNMYKDNAVGRFSTPAINNIINELSSELSSLDVHLIQNYRITDEYSDYINYWPTFKELLGEGNFFLNCNTLYETYTSDSTFVRGNLRLQLSPDGTPHVCDIISMRITRTLPNWNENMFSYNVKYTPYVNSVICSNKKDNNGKNVFPGYARGLSILENQSEKNLDLKRFCKSQQSLINRLGERIAYLDVKVNTSEGSTLWPLGDFIRITPDNNTVGDCWKIVQRELTQYNENTYKVRYTLAENFNANNAQITLDREKRSYDIPLDGYVDRYIYVKVPNGTNLKNYNKTLVRALDYENYSCYAESTLTVFTESNKTFAKTTFLDNYSVCIYNTTITQNNSDVKVNVPLQYGGPYSNTDNITISLVNAKDIFQNTSINILDLPKITDTQYASINNKYSRTLYGINKDKFERLIFVFYQDN